MENNEQKVKEKKGGTGFLVFIIVVLLIIIGVGVGWYFGKNGNEIGKKQENTTNTTNTVEKTENTTNAINNTNTTGTTSNKEMTADERYSIYSKGVQKEIEKIKEQSDKYKDEQYSLNTRIYGEKVGDSENFPVSGIWVNEKKEVYIAIKETGDPVKLYDNAIDCGIVRIGNGGEYFVIWAIDTNGNLCTHTFNATGDEKIVDVKLTKKQGLKNIVTVAQYAEIGGASLICFDIDGNRYNVYD